MQSDLAGLQIAIASNMQKIKLAGHKKLHLRIIYQVLATTKQICYQIDEFVVNLISHRLDRATNYYQNKVIDRNVILLQTPNYPIIYISDNKMTQ
jgi:hypothetical protein